MNNPRSPWTKLTNGERCCYWHTETSQFTRQRPAEGVGDEQELDTATFDDFFANAEASDNG